MISAHNWTKGNDRSSNGRIIENNWANCGFEKLASSALRGRNMSMWRGERWTEEKPDLNDNEQNTRLHFASAPEDRSAYLNNQPVHVSMSHVWEKMSTFDLCIISLSSFSLAWGPYNPGPGPKSLLSTEEATSVVKTAWSLCWRLNVRIWHWTSENKRVSIYRALSA